MGKKVYFVLALDEDTVGTMVLISWPEVTSHACPEDADECNECVKYLLDCYQFKTKIEKEGAHTHTTHAGSRCNNCIKDDLILKMVNQYTHYDEEEPTLKEHFKRVDIFNNIAELKKNHLCTGRNKNNCDCCGYSSNCQVCESLRQEEDSLIDELRKLKAAKRVSFPCDV